MPSSPARRPWNPGRRLPVVAAISLAVALLILWVFFKPLLHGPVMSIWRAPFPWVAALAVIAIGLLVSRRIGPTVADVRAGRNPRLRGYAITAGVAFFTFGALQSVNNLLVLRSLASNTTYERIDGLPSTGVVRLVPREVAGNIMNAGFNSPTERLTDLKVINTADGLKWSAIRTPQGAIRKLTKRSGGLVLQDAQNPGRSLDELDAEFKYGPGLAIFDSLSWQLKERRLLCDLTAPVGILDKDGKPLILVPYITYTGFPIRRPKLGGAFLVQPDGTIEDLTPEQAAKRPEIAASGRLYPDTLSRRIHDAYALKGGIWNYLVTHTDQTQIVDTESNPQPYLLQGQNNTASWVSVAEPYGRSRATTAIFLTDSTTGNTRLWKVPPKDGLTGNSRAVDIAEAQPIPGIDFGTGGVTAPDSGSFRAMEPRPVFVKGRLYYLVSVVPNTATTVTKTIVVDAQTNQAVEVFDANTTAGLRATLAFLTDGPTGETGSVSDDDPQSTTPAADEPASTTPLSRAELQRRIDALVETQQQSLKELQQLQRALEAQR